MGMREYLCLTNCFKDDIIIINIKSFPKRVMSAVVFLLFIVKALYKSRKEESLWKINK